MGQSALNAENREIGPSETAYTISVCGRPRFVGRSVEEHVLPVKTYLLTAFLALSGDRATSRAQLAELLWPEEDADKSHANLRQLIARIRAQQASLGFRLVDATPSTIRLAPVNVRIDLADILERLRSRRPEDIQELCSLYGGDLLEDAERETDAGRDWIALRRAHLRETVTGALCRFLEEESGADDQLILAAERLLEIDPYQEAGYRALMRVYARLGQKYQVRRVFELCQSRLFADLETGPAQETSALFHELAARRAEGWRAPTGVTNAVADVSPSRERGEDAAGVPRISLLPPSNGIGGAARRSLVGWLLQDVTIGLCRLRSVSVVAPYTSWSLDPAGTEPQVDRFGIDYLVATEGVEDGGAGALYVQLLTARSRRIQWAERFAIGPTTLAACYREISLKIAASLADAVEQAELARLDSARDPTAYRWFLLGQRELRNFDLPGVRRARRAFKQRPRCCSGLCGGVQRARADIPA